MKFAKENNVPHDVCGKVVVAATEAEQPSLNKIFKLGLENKIEGIELINGSQLREIEPECRGEAAPLGSMYWNNRFQGRHEEDGRCRSFHTRKICRSSF